MMRHGIRILLLLAGILALSTTVRAQKVPYSYGIEAAYDIEAENTIRERMDSIRAGGRPTVALVLSGGGAKGAAHIGVLRYLESIGMPIDLVLGTSMGGLVGGMYAAGYSAGQIDTMIRALDWNILLSDRLPDSYIPLSEKQYRQKYVISIPFYYADRKKDKLHEDLIHGDDIQLGAEDSKSMGLKDNLMRSLPSGMVYGHNVNNLFSQLTVGYQHDTAFYDLPIPFACIATEMVTAKPKIWYSGKLNTALRSTMSIPGLFTPVKTDGMVLVDGGMRNNYPTDLAYSLGADLVIGVDLSSGYLDYDKINNFSDLLTQFIDMFGRESYERNHRLADITLVPELKGYDMLSFDDKSIGIIIERGWESALSKEGDLLAMKQMVGSDTLRLQSPKAINLQEQKVLIKDIEIDGVTRREFEYLMGHIDIRPGMRLGKEEIEGAEAYIYSTRAFDFVTYELLGSSEPFRLRFNCRKGPINLLGIGARFDTEEVVSALINIGLNVNSIQGHAFELTGKIGTNPFVEGHYYYKTASGPTINAVASFKYVDHNRFLLGSNNFNMEYYDTKTRLYLSNIKLAKMDFKIGIQSDNLRLRDVLMSDFPEETSGYMNNTYLSLFATLKAETFDNIYFPTKGMSISCGYDWVFGGLKHKVDPFHVAKVDFKTVANLGGNFSVLPFVHSRMAIGSGVELPYVNLVGGRIAGRYLDQQVPFMGVTNAVAVGNYMAIAGADFRYKLFKNNYLTATANFGTAAPKLKQLFDFNLSSAFAGFGLEYAYNSIIGPIRGDIHWSTLTNDVGVYLSIGFDF